MVWLQNGEKGLRIRFLILTEYTYVMDKRMDRQIPHDGIGHAYT